MLRRRMMLAQGGVSLPEGYTKIEYLQSNGNQHIDTGFVPNQDTRVVVDARMTSVATTTAAIFGAGTTATSTSKVVFYQASSGLFAADYANKNTRQVFDGVEALDRLYIDYDKNVCTINGVTRTWTSTTFSPDANLTLFCWNANGNLVYYIEAAIYSCKIYDNGVLVRDYIPCTNPDGISGLWDSVNDVFYKMLPAGYTKLDFIESNGTQYIDTGFKPNQDTRVVMHIRPLASTLSGNTFLFGGMQDNSSRFAVFYHKAKNSWAVDYISDANRQYFSDTKIDQDLYIDYNKNVCTFNGEQKTFSASTFQSTLNMLLFGVNYANVLSSFIAARLYSCKIYDNGTLVRDFIPAMNASGEAGLYDLKNDVWYALLPAVKPKVENKISIWHESYRNEDQYGFKASYPLTSDISISYHGMDHIAFVEMPQYYNNVFIFPSGYESQYVARVAWFDSISQYVGRTIVGIYSISPTEDDTYIYTF